MKKSGSYRKAESLGGFKRGGGIKSSSGKRMQPEQHVYSTGGHKPSSHNSGKSKGSGAGKGWKGYS